MRILRVFLFILAIAAGVAGGLYAGWVLRPMPAENLSIRYLRQDFRTDYILMTAEAYALDGDAPRAAARLALLGNDSPARMVQEAILTGRAMGYSMQDLECMAYLAQALLTLPPAATEAAP